MTHRQLVDATLQAIITGRPDAAFTYAQGLAHAAHRENTD